MAIHTNTPSTIRRIYHQSIIFLIICLPTEFIPVLGPLTQLCASTLGAALLCSTRAGSVLGLVLNRLIPTLMRCVYFLVFTIL